jgi:uncharacterized protein YidB (DUF937 family)
LELHAGFLELMVWIRGLSGGLGPEGASGCILDHHFWSIAVGLLDGLAGQVLGSLAGSNGSQQGGLIAAIASLIAQQPGGLAGLIQSFQQNGLGAVASSWVGTGSNLPITAEQLQSVLGSEQLQSIAAMLGVSPHQASGHLAEVLPQVVDKLTPAGELPAEGDLGSLLGSVGQLLGR